jgi:hypothetical protein
MKEERTLSEFCLNVCKPDEFCALGAKDLVILQTNTHWETCCKGDCQVTVLKTSF